MSDDHTHFMLELLRTRLMERIQKDLSIERQDQVALRKALLTLIMLTQDGAGPTARRFIEYLLNDFRQLSDHFSSAHDHLLFGQHTVGRRHSTDEGLVLALDKTLVGSVLGKPVNDRELALLGELVPWELTAQRYVGFYDIMGFRALIERHQGNHDLVYELLKRLHDVAARAQELYPDGVHSALKHSRSLLRAVQFSDSILVVTRDASATASLLIQLVSQMLFLHALQLGTILRGAMAFGNVSADFQKSIFFGQPIIDAYLLEEDQAWYGIVQHDSVQNAERESGRGSPEARPIGNNEIPLTVEYRVPLKSLPRGDTKNAINWPVFCESHSRLDQLLSNLRDVTSEKLRGYYRATHAFGHEMLERFGIS